MESDDSENEGNGQQTDAQRGRQTSDGVEVTPRRTPLKSKSQTPATARLGSTAKSTGSRRTTIAEDDNDENVANSPSVNGNNTPTASSKKRRLSKSGRASIAAEPEDEDGDQGEATPPPPSANAGPATAAARGRKSKTPASARRGNAEDEDDEGGEVLLNGSGNEAEESKAIKKQDKLVRDPKDG